MTQTAFKAMIGCQNLNILCFFKYDVTYNTKYNRKSFYGAVHM